MLDSLAVDGFVRRARSDRYRRLVLVSLTDRGRPVVRERGFAIMRRRLG